MTRHTFTPTDPTAFRPDRHPDLLDDGFDPDFDPADELRDLLTR